MLKLARYIIATLMVGMVSLSQAAQYWDPSSTAGFQPGDGFWSTVAADANWNNGSGNGVPSTWVNDTASAALFGENGGTSRITISNANLSCWYVQVDGQNYAVVQTNGGRLLCTYVGGSSFKLSSSNLSWLVAGSSSATSILNSANTGGASMYLGSTALPSSNVVLTVDGGGFPNSAIVTNSGSGSVAIGNYTGSQNCGINVVNGGYWHSGDITVGTTGATNCFINVDNGTLKGVGSVYIYGVSGRAVVKNGGQLATGGAGLLQVGNGNTSTNCSLTVDGGQVAARGNGRMQIAGSYSTLIITNGGFVTNSGGVIYIGGNGTVPVINGTVIVAGGSSTQSLWSLGGMALTVGTMAGSISNEVRVDGAGLPNSAVITNAGALIVGNGEGSIANGLVATNGGRLFTAAAVTIGSGSLGNYARVVGSTGSLWNVGNQTLTIGSGNVGNNSLTIDGKGVLGGAMVTNVGALAVGYSGAARVLAANNSVLVTNGGVLYLGAGAAWGQGTGHGIGMADNQINTARSNTLEIVQGGRVYSSGSIFVGYNDYNAILTGNRLIVRDIDSLLDMRNNAIYAPLSAPANAASTSGVDVLIDGGVVTNVAGLFLAHRTTGANLNGSYRDLVGIIH